MRLRWRPDCPAGALDTVEGQRDWPLANRRVKNLRQDRIQMVIWNEYDIRQGQLHLLR
jgi:hypothetical protein